MNHTKRNITVEEAKYQRKILGMKTLEYSNVMHNTSCREFMIKAHSTSLTQPQAMWLWIEVIRLHNLKTDGFRFVWTKTRKCRGGVKMGNGYIKLNVNQLTVGIVLHEMAHVLQYLKFKMFDVKPHGSEFVMLFDQLLREYFSNQLTINL